MRVERPHNCIAAHGAPFHSEFDEHVSLYSFSQLLLQHVQRCQDWNCLRANSLLGMRLWRFIWLKIFCAIVSTRLWIGIWRCWRTVRCQLFVKNFPRSKLGSRKSPSAFRRLENHPVCRTLMDSGQLNTVWYARSTAGTGKAAAEFCSGVNAKACLLALR